jgi:hypothetical protein
MRHACGHRGGKRQSAGAGGKQSTATVDNFVRKSVAGCAKWREYWVAPRLHKMAA